MNKKLNNVFCFQKIGESLVCQQKSPPIKSKINLIESKSDQNSNEFTVQQECFKNFDDFFQSFESDLYLSKLSAKCMDKLISMTKNLIKSCETLQETLFNEYEMEAISVGLDYVNKKLCSIDSPYKREKKLEQNRNYAKPVEKPIGLKWQSNIDPTKNIVEHKLVQTKYSYVPVLDTIHALFSNKNVEEMYIKYNTETKHNCVEGIFQDFCCGSVRKKHKVFDSTVALQIQLSIDDFEPCDPLKSKKGNQKTCGIYFEIRNIPSQFRSKMDTKFLVALIKTSDLKADADAIDGVVEQIVNELKFLEKHGVIVSPGLTIKGGLINICFDNLGGNSLLGFAESFVAHYYCRICELHRSECQKALRENSFKLRKISEYRSYLNVIEVKGADDLKLTKGLKRHCIFNQLNHFHMYDNLSVDIMHDIYEGAVPFFMSIFFDTLMKNHIFNSNEILAKVRDFNYGYLNKNYKPSLLKFEGNLNQNGKQLYCLMLHLPFIFAEIKPNLKREWDAMIKLLQIMQIVHSNYITEEDLSRLEELVSCHLRYIIEREYTLLPKHHFLTHYATVIRRMGPLVLMWMMRAESKHRIFTDIADNTHNFVNLPKTMANKHQQRLAFKQNIFANRIVPSKVSFNVEKTENYNLYKDNICGILSEGFKGLKFLSFNSYEFRPGLMILTDNIPFEIMYIFQKNQTFKLLCHRYLRIGFDESFNSVEISKVNSPGSVDIFDVDESDNMKTYNKILCQKKTYIIADTLNVFNSS